MGRFSPVSSEPCVGNPMRPGTAAPQGQHAAVHLAPQPLIGVAPHPFLERPMCWAETLGGVREWDPPLPRGNEDMDPPGTVRTGVSPAGATVSASGKGHFCLVNYYKISLPAQKGHKTIYSVGRDAAIWFLIKNHDVKNKIEFCNNSTESRRASPRLALQSVKSFL